ncbi:hypothetical protein JTE90_002375 [Oedothorax gibbosus]|uniref:Uncharacterized protein n=1 Tax=Oedothorax gibbosus TaxID=931172 RepID=A0AAV6VBX5_9ARAC|nr:hypothetical protein JTE90_002375 [Oedothorax gibbosus]
MTDRHEDIIPKIVITEPSLLPGFNTGLAQNVVQVPDEMDVVAPAPAPEPKVADFIVESTEDETTDGSISPSVSDIDSCSVSVEKPEIESMGTAVQPQNNGLLQVPGETDDEEEDDDNEDDLRNVEVGAYDLCWRWLQGFADSKFMFPILMVLLVMPISSGFMGARYMDRCPLSSSAPLFLFMLGVLGTLVILCRMVCIACGICGRGGQTKTLGMVVVFGNLAILLLLCTEMTTFLRQSPSFEPGTPNYCHRTFYNFTYWLNWTTLFVIAFLAVIHAPKFSRQEDTPATVDA